MFEKDDFGAFAFIAFALGGVGYAFKKGVIDQIFPETNRQELKAIENSNALEQKSLALHEYDQQLAVVLATKNADMAASNRRIELDNETLRKEIAANANSNNEIDQDFLEKRDSQYENNAALKRKTSDTQSAEKYSSALIVYQAPSDQLTDFFKSTAKSKLLNQIQKMNAQMETEVEENRQLHDDINKIIDAATEQLLSQENEYSESKNSFGQKF